MRAVQKNVTATVALTACFAFAAPTQDVTFAAEIPSNGQYGGLPRNSSFDDIVITDPTLSFQQMQPGYNGLAWENMTALLIGGGLLLGGPLTGVPAHSGFQAVAFSPQLLAAAYSPQIVPPPGATAAISTSFLGSRTKSFDLQEFWFGCFVSSPQSIDSAPQACTLDVTGWKEGSDLSSAPNVMQSFTYWANNLVKAPMMYARLVGGHWDNMQKVAFTRKTVGLLDQITEGIVMDDVAVVLHE